MLLAEEIEVGELDVEHYYDGKRIHIGQKLSDAEVKLSAYTYPPILDSDSHDLYGLSFRTMRGHIELIHMYYDVVFTPETVARTTADGSSTTSMFGWNGRANPNRWGSSHLVVQIEEPSNATEWLLDTLYGTDDNEPRLPLAFELVSKFDAESILKIQEHADGSYTASGPDDWVRYNGDGTFTIKSPSLLNYESGRFRVQSY